MKILPPPQGIYLGAYDFDNGVQVFEQAVGTKLAIIGYSPTINDGGTEGSLPSFDTQGNEQAFQQGYISTFSVETTLGQRDDPPFVPHNIISGEIASALEQVAGDIKAWGRPIFWLYAREPSIQPAPGYDGGGYGPGYGPEGRMNTGQVTDWCETDGLSPCTRLYDQYQSPLGTSCNLTAGIHTFQISGRSTNFNIDRIHLYLDGTSNPTDPSLPQSAIQGTSPPPPLPAVESFSLINADTDGVIAKYDPLAVSGAIINLQDLPTKSLNLRAKVVGSPGSVRFTLNGASYRLENSAPFALAGDDGLGDYYAWTPAVGSYTVQATPFTLAGGGGQAGTALTVSFSVVNTPPPPPPDLQIIVHDAYVPLPDQGVYLDHAYVTPPDAGPGSADSWTARHDTRISEQADSGSLMADDVAVPREQGNASRSRSADEWQGSGCNTGAAGSPPGGILVALFFLLCVLSRKKKAACSSAR